MPSLRRTDARHRDFRTSAAHPRTADFTESSMSFRRSSCKNSLLALHRTVLSRGPIVIAADIPRSCTPQPLKSGSCRPDIASRGAGPGALVPPSSLPSPLLRSNPHSSSLPPTPSVRLRGFLPWGLSDVCLKPRRLWQPQSRRPGIGQPLTKAEVSHANWLAESRRSPRPRHVTYAQK